jgi:adenylate cyclase
MHGQPPRNDPPGRPDLQVNVTVRDDRAGAEAVTNLGARLCGEAREAQILIPSRVLGLVAGLVDTQEVGALTLKGSLRPSWPSTSSG